MSQSSNIDQEHIELGTSSHHNSHHYNEPMSKDEPGSNSGLISGVPNDEMKYRQSNWVQKSTCAFVMITIAMLIVVIAVSSATFQAIKTQIVYAPSITQIYPAVGLPGYSDYAWNDVVAVSAGQTVNFWTYTTKPLNIWLNNWLIPEVKALYNINIKVIPLAATVTAVNQVQYEIRQNIGMNNGSVDIIWINGANFATLYNANQLYGPWTTKVPNAENYDFSNPAISYDAGVPINGMEMPYNGAQVVFIYNTNFFNSSISIDTMPEIGNWIKANPQKFTYANPSTDFTGAVFVRQALYAFAGPYTDYLASGVIVNEALYAARTPALWQWLRSLEPFLYSNNTYTGQKKSYPSSNTVVDWLFGQQKTLLTLSYQASYSAAMIKSGHWPKNVMSYVLSTGTIANSNYLCIPANAKHKLAAVTVINYIASAASMFTRAQPSVWGASQVYNPGSVQFTTGGWQLAFNTMQLDPSTPSGATLNANKVGELSAIYQARINADWVKCVQNYVSGASTGGSSAPQPAYCG